MHNHFTHNDVSVKDISIPTITTKVRQVDLSLFKDRDDCDKEKKVESRREELWNAFHQLICAIPYGEIERNQENIRIIGEHLEYPEEELWDLCEFGYITPREQEDMVADMMKAEEEQYE